MKRSGFACLLMICLAWSSAVMAQQSRVKLSEETIAQMRANDRKMNGPKEGMILSEFTAYTTDGKLLTNSFLKGKVSLLIFWDPWCMCFKPEALGALPELVTQQKNFQILSIMSDTGRLASFISDYLLQTPVLILQNGIKMRDLNGNNGIPSAVLVDREGTMVKISGMLRAGIFDEQSFTEKIRELLLF